jgi:2-polyprenyl-3-methyl-5-hydroxy-6-metoxy-1,4-benzoquinol methylase
MFTKQIIDDDKSPKNPLLTERELVEHVRLLRQHLAKDTATPLPPDIPRGWWQRIAIPGTDRFTTSDHDSLEISDPGYLNRLGGALTTQEGFILRPMPKWAYLKPIFPDVSGKSILEIGCNNGFFCFEFEQLRAAMVTGAEVFEGFIEPARWMANARGSIVDFLMTDALLDLSLPAHDIVFMSEVYAHFVDPFFGLLRAINLAKEILVIDSATLSSLKYEIDLGAGIDPATGKMTYHFWILSDGLMLAYLLLCGIPPENVTRYVAPWPNHIVYVIDTREVAKYRAENDFQPCNTSFINAAWKF